MDASTSYEINNPPDSIFECSIFKIFYIFQVMSFLKKENYYLICTHNS